MLIIMGRASERISVLNWLASLPPHIAGSKQVCLAMEAWGALSSGRFSTFIRIMRTKADVWQRCLMFRLLPHVRNDGLRQLNRAMNPKLPPPAAGRPPPRYASYSLRSLSNVLALGSEAAALRLLEHHGLAVEETTHSQGEAAYVWKPRQVPFKLNSKTLPPVLEPHLISFGGRSRRQLSDVNLWAASRSDPTAALPLGADVSSGSGTQSSAPAGAQVPPHGAGDDAAAAARQAQRLLAARAAKERQQEKQAELQREAEAAAAAAAATAAQARQAKQEQEAKLRAEAMRLRERQVEERRLRQRKAEAEAAAAAAAAEAAAKAKAEAEAKREEEARREAQRAAEAEAAARRAAEERRRAEQQARLAEEQRQREAARRRAEEEARRRAEEELQRRLAAEAEKRREEELERMVALFRHHRTQVACHRTLVFWLKYARRRAARHQALVANLASAPDAIVRRRSLASAGGDVKTALARSGLRRHSGRLRDGVSSLAAARARRVLLSLTTSRQALTESWTPCDVPRLLSASLRSLGAASSAWSAGVVLWKLALCSRERQDGDTMHPAEWLATKLASPPGGRRDGRGTGGAFHVLRSAWSAQRLAVGWRVACCGSAQDPPRDATAVMFMLHVDMRQAVLPATARAVLRSQGVDTGQRAQAALEWLRDLDGRVDWGQEAARLRRAVAAVTAPHVEPGVPAPTQRPTPPVVVLVWSPLPAVWASTLGVDPGTPGDDGPVRVAAQVRAYVRARLGLVVREAASGSVGPSSTSGVEVVLLQAPASCQPPVVADAWRGSRDDGTDGDVAMADEPAAESPGWRGFYSCVVASTVAWLTTHTATCSPMPDVRGCTVSDLVTKYVTEPLFGDAGADHGSSGCMPHVTSPGALVAAFNHSVHQLSRAVVAPSYAALATWLPADFLPPSEVSSDECDEPHAQLAQVLQAGQPSIRGAYRHDDEAAVVWLPQRRLLSAEYHQTVARAMSQTLTLPAPPLASQVDKRAAALTLDACLKLREHGVAATPVGQTQVRVGGGAGLMLARGRSSMPSSLDTPGDATSTGTRVELRQVATVVAWCELYLNAVCAGAATLPASATLEVPVLVGAMQSDPGQGWHAVELVVTVSMRGYGAASSVARMLERWLSAYTPWETAVPWRAVMAIIAREHAALASASKIVPFLPPGFVGSPACQPCRYPSPCIVVSVPQASLRPMAGTASQQFRAVARCRHANK